MKFPNPKDPYFYEKLRATPTLIEPFIEKVFDDIYCYKPHQRFLQNYMNPKTPYQSLLLFHAMGTGKTMSAIGIAEMYRNPKTRIYFLAKNSLLLNNFKSQLKHGCEKFEKIPGEYTLETYTTFTNRMIDKHSLKRKPNKNYSLPDNSVIIIDEIHNSLNSVVFDCLKIVRHNTKNIRIICLSATPMYDSVKDIFKILELLKDVSFNIQNNPELFESEHVLSQKGKNLIKSELPGFVSYIDIDSLVLPKTENFFVDCIPSDHQLQGIYQSQELKDPLYIHEIASSLIVYPDGLFHTEDRNGEFLDLKKIKKYSCKLYNLSLKLKESGKHVIYSNFVNMSAGLRTIENFINYNYSKRTIFVIDDHMSLNSKLKTIKSFNQAKECILICSSTISEGITLRNTDFIHIMDPHWNYARLNQFIGRSVRTNSHDNPQTKTVQIFFYKLNNFQDIFIDEVKYKLSTQKLESIQDIERLLISKSIDCFSQTKHDCDPPLNSYLKTLPIEEKETVPEKLKEFILEKTLEVLNQSLLYTTISELHNIFEEYSISLKIFKEILSQLNVKKTENSQKQMCHIVVLDTFIFLSPIGKRVYSSINTLVGKPIVKEKKKKFKSQKKASKQLDLDFLIQTDHPIFGTYKNKYGEVDGKLRIVDNSELDDTGDNRKVNPGKAVDSYSLRELHIILKKLKIPVTGLYNKTLVLLKLIEFFSENKLIF